MTRTIAGSAAIAVAVLLSACGGSKSNRRGGDQMSADLRRDLELASSPALELASSVGAQHKLDYVSAVERSTGSAPERVSTRTKTPHQRSARTVRPVAVPKVEKVPAPIQVAEAAPVPVNVPVPQPTATPRPASVPADRPSAGGADPAPEPEHGHGGLGGIVGVVIRGGGVDGDHCEIHPGRGGGVIAVNQRIPVIRGTFPRW